MSEDKGWDKGLGRATVENDDFNNKMVVSSSWGDKISSRCMNKRRDR